MSRYTVLEERFPNHLRSGFQTQKNTGTYTCKFSEESTEKGGLRAQCPTIAPLVEVFSFLLSVEEYPRVVDDKVCIFCDPAVGCVSKMTLARALCLD